LLIDFLVGFYGDYWQVVKYYMDELYQSTRIHRYVNGVVQPVTIDIGPNAAYLTPDLVLSQATAFVAGNKTAPQPFQMRLRVALLPLTYVAMLRWQEMQAHALKHNTTWPFAPTLLGCYEDFASVYVASGMNANGDTGLSEGGNGLAWLKQKLGL